MTRDEALRCIGLLVGGTTGWNPESYEIYVDRCVRLTSVPVLLRAVEQILEVWKDARRPPLALVLETYQACLPRTLGLPMGENKVCDMERGLQIMWENYEAECRRLGKEPDTAYHDRWQRAIGAS